MPLHYDDPKKYNELKNEIQKIIEKAQSVKDLHMLKTEFIGDSGFITEEIKKIKELTIEQKKIFGPLLNSIKTELILLTKEKENNFNLNEVQDDLTLIPESDLGIKHIVSESIELLHKIFLDIGFEYFEGPDIEKTYYNFDALNMKEEHPARENNDTFYMNNEKTELLRTQVTAVQIRLLESMLKINKDIRAYSIGNVFRNDDHDPTHSCQFQQIEGIILEKGVTMKHLKGFLEYLLESFFETKVKVVFRPSYFPFTEPSCEVFAYTKIINDKLVLSEEGDPLEIGGCGIIHPDILKNFNKEGQQAFAFGMGLERWIMLKYGIKNIHTLYNNKINELKCIKNEIC